MKDITIIIVVALTLTVHAQGQVVSNNFFSLGVSGGFSLMAAEHAIKDYTQTKFETGATYCFTPAYHFAPSLSSIAFHIGGYVGHHSMELTEAGQSFGTLNITPVMIFLGFGRYEFGNSEAYLRMDLGFGQAFTSFDNGAFIRSIEREYGVTVNVNTDNSFVLDLHGEVGIFLSNSISLFGQGQLLLQNVGNHWTMSGNNQTAPMPDFGDFQASSMQLLIGLRYWGFDEADRWTY
ncbi:MAG: hypothetical protein EPO24_02780 [Bacteroidetes bacterium]|nr:MAG: hypothetical protein EPO24_02780 [Bacteroidota bacterium]